MIEKIKEKFPDLKENNIIVFKGFKNINCSPKNRYFSFSLGPLDEVDFSELKEQVKEDVLKNLLDSSGYKWMTIEEYQLFKEFLNIIDTDEIILVNNNLYDKQYPYNNTLLDIEGAYKKLYSEEDINLSDNDKKLLERVSKFYGKIDYSIFTEKYYVTYPDDSEINNRVDFYEDISLEIVHTNIYPLKDCYKIELSFDEIPFLDLEETIIEHKIYNNVVVFISDNEDRLPFKYINRLGILKELYDIEIFFTTSSIARKDIKNEEEYRKILKNEYNYDSFRDIEFYSDIENHSKKLIRVSQAQIIDDIVNQAENAIEGRNFRDIYITASTGSGKSLMFQIPSLYLTQKYQDDKPLILVITPLIGLMNDQVHNMKRKDIFISETINGNTPAFEKERILEKIKNQEVDMLYLSPETLQARSDIKQLIGDRKIGAVIIDEAHIVTTWGRSFRADYWYLGIYLSKLRKKYRFPIVTFTATAIYGGEDDMYLDTRTSLNMINPISYFGKVRRDDIFLKVRSSDKEYKNRDRDYRKTKNTLALKHLQQSFSNKYKCLMYFPTIKLLIEFYNFLKLNAPDIFELTGVYYGTLLKEKKDEVLMEFQSGEIQFVLATKAFGMGIDIPDISSVYHYAPTGSIVDYIQEIGRVARDKSLVKYGFGVIDFLSRDMNEVKQLYGMSSIKKTEIIEVMKKILSIYREKGNNRNLLISPEDFKNIFINSKRDEESLDNKVKTVLLMIEKDFESPQKLGYSPFVARPRSLFGNDLILVDKKIEDFIMKSSLKNYFEKKYDIQGNYKAVYQVYLGKIWENFYKHMTYPSFKYSLFEKSVQNKLKHSKIFEKFTFTTGVEINFEKNIAIEDIIFQYKKILNCYKNFANEYRISNKMFTIREFGEYLSKELKIADRFTAKAFAQTIINASFEFSKIKEIKFISERPIASSGSSKFKINLDADIFNNFIMTSLRNVLNAKNNCIKEDNKITFFTIRGGILKDLDAIIASLGIGESFSLLSYQIIGGNDPQIYLRMNSVYPLEKSIKQGASYRNSILSDVQKKHFRSVAMFDYLFKKKIDAVSNGEKVQKYSKWFWDTIEDYFMGIIPNEVKEELSREKVF